MEYINHVTFNSGHCVKNVPRMTSEVSDFLDKTIEDAKTKRLGDVRQGTVLSLAMVSEYTYIATLYNNRTEQIPILSTAGSIFTEDIKQIWGVYKINKELDDWLPNMIKTPKGPKCIDVPEICPAPAPAVIDLLFMPAMLFPDIMCWTGSFTNALAWKILGDKIHEMKN